MEPIPKVSPLLRAALKWISVIGVGEQVGGELVVIPYKTMLDIASYAADTDFGKVFVHYITVECPYSDIHSESFGGGTPRVFCRRGSVNVYMESGRWSIWAVTFPALNASRQTNAICCSFILYGLVYTRVTGLLKARPTPCFENRFRRTYFYHSSASCRNHPMQRN